MLRRGGLAVVLMLGVVPAACGEDCGDVDCGEGGAVVEWRHGELPDGGVRLCVDGTCSDVRQPEPLTGGRVMVSFNPKGGVVDLGDDIAVRLELIADGRVLEGKGQRSGACCPAYYLEVSGDGRELVPGS